MICLNVLVLLLFFEGPARGLFIRFPEWMGIIEKYHLFDIFLQNYMKLRGGGFRPNLYSYIYVVIMFINYTFLMIDRIILLNYFM